VESIPVYPSFYDYSIDEQQDLKTWAEKAIDEAIISAIYKMRLKQDEKSFFIF